MPLAKPLLQHPDRKVGMKPISLPGFGLIEEVYGVWYDVGLDKLNEIGSDFSKLTTRNTAYIRTQLPLDHTFNIRGNWLFEELVSDLEGFENPVLILGNGPVYNNYLKAGEDIMGGLDIFIDEPGLVYPEYLDSNIKRMDKSLTKLIRKEAREVKKGNIDPMKLHTWEIPNSKHFWLPVKEMVKIDVSKLSDPAYFNDLSPELKIAVLLFRDQTASYAEKILLPSNITELIFMQPQRQMPTTTLKPYVEPMWMGSIRPSCGSCLVGCICGNWMRGVKPFTQN